MSKWMCDVVGIQGCNECKIEEVISKGITHETLEKFIGERGNLPHNVKEFIKSLGYEWSDSGGGAESWHLGVPFTDYFEAVNYLLRMTIQFQGAIKAGLLSLKLMTWSPENW